MEKDPEQEKFEAATVEQNEATQLPYFKQEEQQLPKDYDATIERLTVQLAQNTPTTTEGKTLFATALAISFILLFVQLMEFMSYPKWMEFLHYIFIFVEASIPFIVSFFLKNPKQATLTRLIGVIVLVVYLFTLF